MLKVKSNSDEELTTQVIFLSVDHLRQGQYELQVLNNNEVIKRVNLKK